MSEDSRFAKFHEACLDAIMAVREMRPDPGSAEAEWLKGMEQAEDDYRAARMRLLNVVSRLKR